MERKLRSVLFLIFLLTLTTAGQTNKNLIISEVMFRPHGSNNEFIELFNISAADTINLKKIKIKYYKSSFDEIDTTKGSFLLFPKTFAVIFEGDYSIANGRYSNIVPPKALQLKIKDNAFGTSGMSNSLNRPVYLLNSRNDTLDYYIYSANNKEGISDERFFLDSLHLNNLWKNSIKDDGTPGKWNSTSPLNYDLTIENIGFSSSNLREGLILQGFVKVLNSGLNAANQFDIELFDDSKMDSITQADELVFQKNNLYLNSFDSLNIKFNTKFNAGRHLLIARVNYSADEDTTNNIFYKYFNVLPKPLGFNNIVINEIMYNPKSNQPEWIELFNNTQTTISLKGWKIKDNSTTAFISSNNVGINPGSYLVIADDSISPGNQPTFNYLILNLPSLNNGGDQIILIDSTGKTIDSVFYSANWGGNKGYSLERISSTAGSNIPGNWGSSISRFHSTPSRLNSITPTNYDLAISTFKQNSAYHIFNKPFNATIVIFNNGLLKSDSAYLSIYLDVNRDSIPQPNELIAEKFIQPINSKDSIKQPLTLNGLPLGSNYLIFNINYPKDEFPDNNVFYSTVKTVEIKEVKGDVVINEIMYAPLNDEPEWVELFNKSNKIINLKNYSLSDDRSSKIIIKNNFKLAPEDFVVIARDSNFFNFHNANPVIIANFPTLNNSYDAVVIRDSLNRTIDSVFYFKNWGGSKGRSLERISVSSPSTDSSNWAECKYAGGSTPCLINSVTKKDYDLQLSKFFTARKFINADSSLIVFSVVKNAGIKNADNAKLLIYNDANKNHQFENSELLINQTLPFLNAADSIFISNNIGRLPLGNNTIYSLIDFPNDQDTTNNKAYLNINSIKFELYKGNVVFNELMYAPPSGQPEWLELFNITNKNLLLKNFYLNDKQSKSVITSFIPAKSYLVIAKDSSILNYYKINSTLLVTDFPSLNNNGDVITLKDSLGRIIDSLKYFPTWGGKGGKSLERLSPIGATNDSLNWATSKSPANGTPGKINSVSQKDYDVEIIKFFSVPQQPFLNQSVDFYCKLKNIGKNFISFSLELFDSTNNSALAKVYDSNIFRLNPDDSINIKLNFKIKNLKREHFLEIIANSPTDQDITNNKDSLLLSPSYLNNSLIINEIMYNPYDEPEWIELFNKSQDTINIKNWEISDLLQKPDSTLITNENNFVLPNSYIVITKDSSFLNYHSLNKRSLIITKFANLNNLKDGIKLLDETRELIDSVFYDDNYFHSHGHSIERIFADSSSTNFNNWGISKNKHLSTPGFINSISPRTFDLSVDSIFSFPPFPRSEDSIKIGTIIRNNGTKSLTNIKLYFNVQNSSLFEPFDSLTIHNLNIGDTFALSSAKKLFIKDSIYLKVLAKLKQDDDTTNNYLTRTIYSNNARNNIFISEIMTLPEKGNPQWIEIANVSNNKISINGWYIQTNSQLLSLNKTMQPILINPASFFVISKDSIKNIFSNSQFMLIPKLKLSLRTGSIKIVDFRGETIDSLYYSNNWPIIKNHSLEKIDLSSGTNDSTNWLFSLDANNSTPGKINSVSCLQPSLKSSVVINEIMYEPGKGKAEYIELFNTSNNPINIGGWQLQVSTSHRYFISLNNKILNPNKFYLLSSDSSIFKTFKYLMQDTLLTIANVSSLNLTDSGTQIICKDALGNLIDSVFFNPDWHNKNILNRYGKSLERINPNINSNDPMNWSTSVNSMGGTPNKINSVFINRSTMHAKLTIAPNPFSPDNDGYEDFTIISFQLNVPESQVIIRIFDDHGRLVRTLANNKTFSSKGSVIFDGTDDNGNLLRMGIYLVLIQAVNAKNNKAETLKGVLVLAHKLN